MRSGRRGSRRSRARPIGSTPGCWPSSPAATWYRRSGYRVRRCGASGSGRASGCISCTSAPRSRIACTRSSSSTACARRSRICSAPAADASWSAASSPEPWRSNVAASLYLIDVLEEQIDGIERELRRLSVEHRYLPLLMSAPGIGSVLGYTIAAEIGDVERFPTPAKLVSYTGLCPRVRQSGEVDRRGALSKHGPPYLRWALIEAAHNAIRSYPAYRARAERTRARLGRTRGSAIAAITVARSLAEAIWWMLTRNEPFAPAGASVPLTA